MQKFNTLKSIPAYLPIVNIDTDMIIPKQFLKTIKRTGLCKNLIKRGTSANFANKPRVRPGTPVPTFPKSERPVFSEAFNPPIASKSLDALLRSSLSFSSLEASGRVLKASSSLLCSVAIVRRSIEFLDHSTF